MCSQALTNTNMQLILDSLADVCNCICEHDGGGAGARKGLSVSSVADITQTHLSEQFAWLHIGGDSNVTAPQISLSRYSRYQEQLNQTLIHGSIIHPRTPAYYVLLFFFRKSFPEP